MKSKASIVVMIFGLIAVLSGCAPKTYLLDLTYLPEQEVGPTGKVAAICPWVDVRKGIEADVIGVRHRGNEKVSTFKIEALSISEVVTQAVRDYFTDKGFQVADCTGWDMTPEGLDRLPGDSEVVVGGKVESLLVEATPGALSTNVHYTVGLRAHIGKIAERTVVTRSAVGARKEKQVGFDPEQVEETLNSVLSETLQELFREYRATE